MLSPRGPARSVALLLGVVLPLFALGLYIGLGGADGARRESADDASSAVAEPSRAPASRAELLAHLERTPRDGRAWVLLARLDFDADRFDDAARAYGKALEASAKVARDPAIWCEYADASGMTQHGSLAGRPQALIERALALDPHHPKALEMAGSAAYERGDFAGAAGYWRQLLAQMPAGTPARRELEAALARTEAEAFAATDK